MDIIDPDVLDLYDEGRANVRGLIKIELGGGTYGFVKARSQFTWSSLTYYPGSIIKVSDLSAGTGLAARQFTLTLAESPDDGLTPEVLQTIENEDYRDRPVTIYDAYFHPDTGELLSVRAIRKGYIDQITHEDGEDGYTITAECETRAIDYTRTNGRKRNTSDQARRAPGDLIYEHAARRAREQLAWGRATITPPAATSVGSIFGGG